MFMEGTPRKIYAYSEVIDMRKSFTGLLTLVHNVLKRDSLSGDVYVFVNRKANLLKCIYWDRTGYCLFAKRLEGSRFKIPVSEDIQGGTQELTEKIFKLILDGIRIGRRR